MSPEDFAELDAWNEMAWKSGETPNELACSKCGKLVSPSSLDYDQVCDECNREPVPEPNLTLANGCGNPRAIAPSSGDSTSGQRNSGGLEAEPSNKCRTETERLAENVAAQPLSDPSRQHEKYYS